MLRQGLPCSWFTFQGGFTKIRGTILGGPNSKDYSILGSILGPLILGNYHMGLKFRPLVAIV